MFRQNQKPITARRTNDFFDLGNLVKIKRLHYQTKGCINWKDSYFEIEDKKAIYGKFNDITNAIKLEMGDIFSGWKHICEFICHTSELDLEYPFFEIDNYLFEIIEINDFPTGHTRLVLASQGEL